MIWPKGEKVCLIICSTNKIKVIKFHVQLVLLKLQLNVVDKLGLTCETCCDAPTVDGAVTGAGLVDHLIKRQLLGIGCLKEKLEHFFI